MDAADTPPLDDRSIRLIRIAHGCALLALALVPLNYWVLTHLGTADVNEAWSIRFNFIAFLQFASGVAAVVAGAQVVKGRRPIGTIVGGVLVAVGAPVGWVLGLAVLAIGGGGSWGRPLRVRGRQLHPSLRAGSDWTEGARPDPKGLDDDTRRALEALWLHDAQKEHASVPAFARIAWLLAAVGAPAELLAWAHRAALEEIDHTRRCFALAAGYAGRSHSVEPMPELLVGGLDTKGDPRVVLAVESLSDGCQLEDFNADVAALCAAVCTEPVTRDVLLQIAAEERSHAEFSWALLTWLIARDRAHVQSAVEEALRALHGYARPTAVSADKEHLVARADAPALRAHGRLTETEWEALWCARLVRTTARARALLDAGTSRLAA